jgi:hypothetical protein
MLIAYEQMLIQTFHHNGNLITSHLILVYKSQQGAQVTEFILSYIGQTGRNVNKDTRNIYVTSGTMTPNLPTHSI